MALSHAPERTIGSLVEGTSCNSGVRRQVLDLYRNSRKKQEGEKDSLLESLEALPLKQALRMGIVRLNESRTPDVVLEEMELHQVLEEVLGTLTSQEQSVIQMIYYQDMSIAEVSSEIGLCPGRVNQIRRTAILKMSHPERARRLRVFLS